MIPFLSQCFCYLIHSAPDTNIKIGYFIEKECLEKFHFSLHVSQISFVNLGKDTTTCIVNSCNWLLFYAENLITYWLFKIFELLLMHYFPIKLQFRWPSFKEVKKLLVNISTNVDEVKFMCFMLGACAFTAYPLLVVKTEELKLES